MSRKIRNQMNAFAAGAPIIAVPMSIGGLMVAMGMRADDLAAISFGSIGLGVSVVLLTSLVSHVRRAAFS